MIYGSVCSGIESASMAWEPLGMNPAWFSEIEKFPSAVLAHHWPEVTNLGDMTRIGARVLTGAIEAPDVLVGGTPCQAFSVAGAREGLSDERGQLTIAYGRLADAIDFRRVRDGKPSSIIVWENVPGVLSSKDNAFGCFLALLAGDGKELELGPRPKQKRASKHWRWDKKTDSHVPKWPVTGCVYGPQRTVAWRVLDAQYFGVAQRRRRVFVIASARKGFDPTKVLFESEGMRRDIAPSREAGEEIAGTLASRTGAGGFPGTDEACSGYVHACYGGNNTRGAIDVATAVNASGSRRYDFESETFAVALRGREGGATAELGGEVGNTLRASSGGGDKAHVLTVHGTQDPDVKINLSHTLGLNNGGENAVLTQYVEVRRLTPKECEALQGLPRNHTMIPWRNKPAEDCPDGPRYKAIGNSKAVPVVRWIGERLINEAGNV